MKNYQPAKIMQSNVDPKYILNSEKEIKNYIDLMTQKSPTFNFNLVNIPPPTQNYLQNNYTFPLNTNNCKFFINS
jgi:hypothetical protein